MNSEGGEKEEEGITKGDRERVKQIAKAVSDEGEDEARHPVFSYVFIWKGRLKRGVERR